jgi:hypothetical protein
MKVVYSTLTAKKSLNSIARNSPIRIFVLLVSFFVMQFQSFSNELEDKDIVKKTGVISAKETLPKSSNRKANFNSISLNTLLKTSYCTGESSTLYADAQGIFNPGNVFSVVLSDSVGSFSNPTIIGTLSSTSSGVQTINFRFPINVSLGTGYRVRIVASNPLTTSPDNNFDIAITTIPVPTSTNQILCTGQSVALNATCNTGIVTWYKSATGDTLLTSTTVSPTVTTNYYPACEDVTTCYSRRKAHTVTVNQLTGISLASSFSSCVGSDLTLPVVTNQTNLTYNWTGPNNFTSTTKIAAITNLTAAKTGTYSAVVTSPNSCSVSATTLVSIGTALPNFSISGDTSICYNGTIDLTAESGSASGVTYSWTGPQSFTATGKSISRSAFTSNGQGLTTYHDGIYRVTATNSTTGCTGTVSVNVHVGNFPNFPTVPPSMAICEGTNPEIVVGFGGANFQNYSWMGPNGFTSTMNATCNATFQCNDASVSLSNFSSSNVGTYSVTGFFKDTNGKTCSVNTSISLTIKSKPVITVTSNSAVCLGQNLNFTTSNNNNTLGISSYTWTGPNNFTSTIQNPSVNAATATATGVYTLVVVGLNQCIATVNATATVTESYPPVVSPTVQVVLSNSITLAATGCAGTLDWYKNPDNQTVTMPVSPIVRTLYYAKCNVSGCISSKSDDVTVSIGAPIAISIKSGNWNDKSTWNIDRVPLAIDSVIIDKDHVVSIQGQYSAKWMSFRGNGTITFGSTIGNLNLLGNPPPSKTQTPTLLTVTQTQIIYANYTNGTTIKLYKNGVYTNQSIVSSGNTWTGLSLTAGLYTITATDVDFSESLQSNSIQFTPQTSTPTLLTVTGSQITYSGYANGTTLKLYKDGVYTNLTVVVNGNTWTGLTLTSGSYTITSTESGKTESAQSNTVQYTSSNIQTTTPILLTVSGTRITYSNYSNGTTLKLFKDGVFMNLTHLTNSNEWLGLNLTSGTYSITATDIGKTESAKSNSEQYIVPSSDVIITEPNKPPYYFSDGHPASHYANNLNLPAIFTNTPQYDPVNDLVWLKNNKIKIGINLKRGGQIAWASLIDATTNLVYNGYDGGFQVTLDAYQRKDGYTQDGEVAGSGIPGSPTFSYNVTQGGDYLNHAASLIDYHPIPNGYYVKLRPIHYPLNAKFSETYIEAWYTIIRQSVKIQYRYTSFRTDGQWNGGGFDGAAVPACFIVNTLNRYKTYTGSNPWTFSPVEGGVLPIQNLGASPLSRQATEHWGMVYNPQKLNSGIGVYNDTDVSSGSTPFTFKQLEVYPGNPPGTEFTNGFTYFHAFNDFNNLTNRGNYVKDLTAYLMLGTEFEIRAEAYRISGHESNIPQF